MSTRVFLQTAELAYMTGANMLVEASGFDGLSYYPIDEDGHRVSEIDAIIARNMVFRWRGNYQSIDL